jgi:hypothetical protein
MKMSIADRVAALGMSDSDLIAAVENATARAYRSTVKAAIAEAKANQIARRFKLQGKAGR